MSISLRNIDTAAVDSLKVLTLTGRLEKRTNAGVVELSAKCHKQTLLARVACQVSKSSRGNRGDSLYPNFSFALSPTAWFANGEWECGIEKIPAHASGGAELYA